MWITVTGGSGSGKSKMAEEMIQLLSPGGKVYLATLEFIDEEMTERIQKHRKMREGKHFITVEAGKNLTETALPKEAENGILLECMSNLLANEMYGKDARKKDAAEEELAEYIVEEVLSLRKRTKHLVVVTNEVFRERPAYEETDRYLRIFGRVNRKLSIHSDVFVESVYGIPVFLKGSREQIATCAAVPTNDILSTD